MDSHRIGRKKPCGDRALDARLLGRGLAFVAAVAYGTSYAVAQAAPVPSLPIQPVAGDSLADSLLVRLQRAEEAIALLRQQLAAQAASATQTGSRARFDISGRVLVNVFYNTWRVNNADVPQFARPDTNAAGRLLRGGLGAAVRQTTLTGTAFVPRTLGGTFSGDVSADFYGGQAASPGGRNFPVLRIRTARGILRWPGVELLGGQDGPLVSGIEPVSVAAIGVPEFGTAGNLWLWLPQLRLTVETGRAVRFGLQGAVLAPTNGDPVGLFDTGGDVAERSRRPALQSRARMRWGPEDQEGEIGFGVHHAWLAAPNNDTLVTSHAYVANVLLPFHWIELRGEGFTGRALRGLGGGGIAQGLNGAGAPVHTRGGWAQINARYHAFVTVGGGCGLDVPRRADLPTPNAAAAAATRLRNRACEAHVIARPDGPIIAGLTFRQLRTSYAAPIGVMRDSHLNLTFGYAF
jgi:hypothetical protein